MVLGMVMMVLVREGGMVTNGNDCYFYSHVNCVLR